MNLKYRLLFIAFFFIRIFYTSAQTVIIPDANFRNALLAYSPTIDVNSDGLIQISEVENLINLYIPSKSISDLTGIEAFKNLKSLTCTGNNLTSIDLSNNLELLNLELARNNITDIDLSKNTKLQILGLQENGLTSIDVSNNKALRELKVENNALTELNVSENVSIWHINFSFNPISTINLSPITYLSVLVANNTLLSSLNLSCHYYLSYVVIEDNPSLNSVCLNSPDYTKRTGGDPDNIYWIKSSNTSWADCPTLPTVTPVPATIVPVDLCETGDMTFNAVSESFITNPTYRWQKATSASGPWTNIPGETNQALELTNLQMADNGSIYKVLISSTDYCGSGHMEEAAGQIVLHPAVYPEVLAASSVSGAVCDTIQHITYTATPVTGEGSAPAYQWYYYNNPTFTPITGATDIQYTPATLPPNGSQLFVGMFTDAMCAVESGVPSNILTVEILPTPEPVITTADIALCNPSGYVIQTNHTAASGTQFQWFKDGSPIAGSNTKNLTITSEGTYYMTEDNGSCKMASDIVTISKTLNAADPIVSITSSLTGPACDTLQQVTYTATAITTSTIQTYQWYDAITNSIISGATNAIYIPAAKPVNGDKVYVMMYTNETCVANPDAQSNTITAQILPTPAPVMLSTNTALCNPTGYVLQTSNTASSGTQIIWYENGNAITNSNTPDFTIASAGTYHVTENNGACEIASAAVTINTLTASSNPKVTISSTISGPVCDTLQQITYIATAVTTSTIQTYQWYDATTNSIISGATNAIYTPATKPVNGDEVYVMMYTNETCAANQDAQSNTITALILPTPAPIMLSTDAAVCFSQQYTLSIQPSTSSGTQIQWYKDGSVVSGTNQTYTINDTDFPGGTYHVTESNVACSMQSQHVNIELMHTPMIYVIDDIYAKAGDQITFNLQADDAGYFQWSQAAGLSNTTDLNPTLQVSTTETYTLQTTNHQNLCPVSTQVKVIVIPNSIQIPNVITANGDGVNDTWEIENLSHYSNATVEIFNRWGSLVWKSKGYSKQWDGTSFNSNGLLPAGTYFYVIQLNATEKSSQSDSYTGYVQLID